MNIKFEEVKGTNFLSLGSVQVDLTNRGFVLVEGMNNNTTDNAKSNGSGKSSLFELIVWIVTGETIRGTKDVVNKATQGGACGELTFSIDNDKYKIVRFRDDPSYGNTLRVYFNGEDVSGKGVRDSSKVLEQYLPDFNAQLLGSVIVLGQGLPQRFTNNTPSGRKEILEHLSKSDYMIEDLKAKLSSRRVDVNTQLRTVQDDILRTESEIDTNKVLIESRKHSIETARSEDELLSAINTAKGQLAADETNLLNSNKQLEEYRATYKSLNDKYSEMSQEIHNKYSKLLLEAKDNSNKALTVVNGINYDIRDLKKRIADAENVETVCPYCKRSLDDIHKIDTSEWKTHLSESETKLVEAQKDVDALEDAYRKIAENERLETASLSDIKKQADDADKKYSEQERISRGIEYSIKGSKAVLDDAERHYAEYQTQMNMWKQDITNAELTIKEKQLIIITKEKEQVLLQHTVEALNKLVNIASKDFRTYLLESVIEFISQRVKHYSPIVFNSDRAEFRSDGNQIWIGYDGKQYENLSGGEKQKVDIIVQFALRDMLMKILGFSCNILVLDEIFDNLDEVGCENLVTLITNELKDIESVFIITHHADISVPSDDKITIVKNENGVSTIL